MGLILRVTVKLLEGHSNNQVRYLPQVSSQALVGSFSVNMILLMQGEGLSLNEQSFECCLLKSLS